MGYQAIGFQAPAVAHLVAVYAAVRTGHHLIAVAGSVLMVASPPFAMLVAHPDWPVSDAFTDARDALRLA